MPGELINGYREAFQELETPTLKELLQVISEVIDSRTDDFEASSAYARLRQVFYQRFNKQQVDMLRPWESLSKAKQDKFKKGWSFAIHWFHGQGFKHSPKLTNMTIRLVAGSPLFHGHLTFDSIIQSLFQIENLFDNSFPEYRVNGGIHFLKDMLNNGNPRSTTCNTTEECT